MKAAPGPKPSINSGGGIWDHQERTGFEGVAAYLTTDLVRHLFRENVVTKALAEMEEGSMHTASPNPLTLFDS